jgi:hypothetical protein
MGFVRIVPSPSLLPLVEGTATLGQGEKAISQIGSCPKRDFVKKFSSVAWWGIIDGTGKRCGS